MPPRSEATGNDEDPTPQRHGVAGRLLKVCITSIVVAGFVTTLHHTGYFESWEARWIDAMSRVFRSKPSGQVVLVAITDEDFARSDLFASTSPLDPATLERLIERISEHQPAIVVVDIQLQPVPHESKDRLANRLQLYDALLSVSQQHATEWILVEPEPWQRNAREVDPEAQNSWEHLQGASADGGRHLRWASAEIRAEQGLIRRMAFTIPSPDAAGESTMTILGGVIEAKQNSTAHLHVESHGHEPMLIRYSGLFTLDHANLNALRAGDILAGNAPMGRTILHGKIVIIGGLHRAGRDYFWTPLGEMPAAAVWAEAVDTWLRGDVPGHVPWPIALLTETLLGLGGGFLMLRFNPLLGYVLAVVLLVPLTFFFSWLSLALGFVFINCLPSFFGVQLHLRVEQWLENRELHRRIRGLEKQLHLGENTGS